MEIKYKSTVDVKLIDKMGDDARIASAAWVSTSAEEGLRRAVEKPEDVPGVINYLMKHRHGTPFEAGTLQFFVHAPIFVWREWHRHRVGFSYNEESGRYKQLDPVFYLPDYDRPMMKVDGWKPGRPKFKTLREHFNVISDIDSITTALDNRTHEKVRADYTYEKFCERKKGEYASQYASYEWALSAGFDPGLARIDLGVGIYSSCWVTTNPRALMHYLSLRTHDESATFVSYPLWEIELAARACEKIFSEGWPITHAAYIKNGRVAP